MELFCTFFSPNCRKPRAVISYLDLDVKVTTLDYSKGEFKSPEFLAINPNGFVANCALKAHPTLAKP